MEEYELYELMENSIYKNIQELSEFCVDDMHVSNYYDLENLMIELWNFRAVAKRNHPDMYKKIMEEYKHGK